MVYWVECLLMARETGVQSQIESYQRLKKWYLIPPCLTDSMIRYISRVKWNNPGKRVVPFPKSQLSSYWTKSIRVILDYGHQLHFILSKAVKSPLWVRKRETETTRQRQTAIVTHNSILSRPEHAVLSSRPLLTFLRLLSRGYSTRYGPLPQKAFSVSASWHRLKTHINSSWLGPSHGHLRI